MKIYFVINKHEDGAYVDFIDNAEDKAFASLSSAQNELVRLEGAQLQAHESREAARLERWNKDKEARDILVASGWTEEKITKVLPYFRNWEPGVFETNYKIVEWEIN